MVLVPFYKYCQTRNFCLLFEGRFVAFLLGILTYYKCVIATRNKLILDCDQSNYSSRIILSRIPAKIPYFMQVAWITHSLLDA